MIKNLDHIAIVVRSIEESSRFYTEQLGLTVERVEVVADQKVKVAFIPVGDTRIELVEPIAEDSPVVGFLNKRGEGLHHICLESSDIDSDLARLLAQDTRMIDREVRGGAHNTRIAFVHPKANSGVLTELSEHPKASPKVDFFLPGETPLRAGEMGKLRSFFESAYKPPSDWKIGMEYECSGLRFDDLSPIEFYGERDIETILAKFRELHPEASPIMEQDFCFGLKPSYGNITLEPGAQIEWSGKASSELDEINEMLHQFLRELCGIGEELGVGFYIAGVDAFHPREKRPWSHKARYKVMRSYLAERGKYAHRMMQQTMSIQFNLDYSDEADALRKYEASRRLQPVFLFLASNSQVYAGEVLEAPLRGEIWLNTDPDRCGLPPAIDSFDGYIQYALDVPMFFLVRDELVPIANGLTFRQFLEQGFEGHRATFADWELHLSTLFPEVRFKKNALELRMFDGNKPELAMSFCALVKGLFFDADVLAQVLERGWSDSWSDAQDLLDLASTGLSDAEKEYLKPLAAEVASRKQPGQRAVELFQAKEGDPQAMFQHYKLCVK